MDERDLFHSAEMWARMDPDPETRAEILQRASDEDLDWLTSHFDPPLTFGTAGIRGPLGPGAARMNRAQVCLVAKGLADSLAIGGVEGPVVVAHDARRESPGFAHDIIAVLRQARRDVIACRGPVATPVASWIARHHEAPAAVVVTASHNPIGDAGVKVYGPEGAQIVPPQDARIRAAMDASVGLKGLADVAPDDLTPTPPTGQVGGLVVIEDAHEDYEELVLLSQEMAAQELVVVTTALHGVAGRSTVRLLEGAGHRVHPVAAQQEPDGTFPTLTNPNPEDPVTLELLLAEARDVGADLALANDPDGDRLAVAVPSTDGHWRILTGNEIGMLLADHLVTEPRHAVVTTVVSTPMIEELAAARGVVLVKTWTGFKWIAAAMDWAHGTRAATPVLGFEEALGFAIDDVVRDKDGIRAAVAVADVAASLRTQGHTLPARLAELQREFGPWVSAAASLRTRPGGAEALVDELVAVSPGAFELGGRPVTAVLDHRSRPADDLLWPELPPATIGELRADGLRVLVRPSGTEPTVKVYVHLHEPLNDGERLERALESLEDRAHAILEEVCGYLGLT